MFEPDGSIYIHISYSFCWGWPVFSLTDRLNSPIFKCAKVLKSLLYLQPFSGHTVAVPDDSQGFVFACLCLSIGEEWLEAGRVSVSVSLSPFVDICSEWGSLWESSGASFRGYSLVTVYRSIDVNSVERNQRLWRRKMPVCRYICLEQIFRMLPLLRCLCQMSKLKSHQTPGRLVLRLMSLWIQVSYVRTGVYVLCVSSLQ